MAVNKNQFIEHIEEGMSRFGMSLESSSAVGDDLNKLVLKDNTYSTGYIALARRGDTKNPGDFWGKVIDSQLKKALQESAYKNEALPAALIVPSNEADTVIAQSAQRGTKPSVYQLFDGYVVIGYNRRDSQKLLRNDTDAVQEENKPSSQTVKEPARTEPAQPETAETEPILKTPDIQAFLNEPKKSSGISPRKLAAAALLGVAVASIPFAINKLKDNIKPIEEVVNDPVLENILTDINEGREGSREIQAALTANAALPDYDLEKLISDGYLKDVARNPNINDEKLRRFASDPDPFVRAAAAHNRAMPEELLRRLAADTSAAVRAAAASNPNLPPDLLDRLSVDKERDVCSAVLESPNLTPLLLDRIEPNIERASCTNKEKIFAGPCVTPATLSYNANNPDPCIRRGVAKNPRTDRDTLNVLRNDSDRLARDGALSNPSMDIKDLMDIFPGSWGGAGGEETDNPERVGDIVAALKNTTTPAFVLHNAVISNPGRYGEAAAQSPVLSGHDAAFLYDYSMPRGGMDGFFTSVNALLDNKELLNLVKSQGEEIPAAGSVSALRGRVNRLFSDNLYNPVTAVQLMDSFRGGPAAGGKNGGRSADNAGAERITLPETGEGGGFFDDDEPILSLDDKEFDRFDEFFGDEETDLPEEADALLKTADSIVDGIMEELLPAMQKISAVAGRNIESGSAEGVSADGEDKTAVSRPVLSEVGIAGDGSGANTNGRISRVTREEPSDRSVPVLSDVLYGKSCKQVDSMLGLF